MKKVNPPTEEGLRPEYRREDLGKGVRGKYYKAYTKGTNLVLLSPDVANAGGLFNEKAGCLCIRFA